MQKQVEFEHIFGLAFGRSLKHPINFSKRCFFERNGALSFYLSVTSRLRLKLFSEKRRLSDALTERLAEMSKPIN